VRDGAKKLLSVMDGNPPGVGDDDGDELVMCAREILDAIKLDDEEALCSALETFVSYCNEDDA
jgi:hypothetical protein